jgi:perosamine synthetase
MSIDPALQAQLFVDDSDYARWIHALKASGPGVLFGLNGGLWIESLEQSMSAFLNVKNVLAVSSGTAALHVALKALGIRAGDEVILSAYGWAGTVAPVLELKARPVFVDVDVTTGNIDPAKVEQALSARARAILVTHLYGTPARMSEIMAIARSHHLSVIEDCAQATGAKFQGRPVGSFGDFGCFSFGPGKPVCTGEGGALCTNDPTLYARAVQLSQHPLRQRWLITDPNQNAQIDGFQSHCRIHPAAACLGLIQLESLVERIHRHLAVIEQLNRLAVRIAPELTPPLRDEESQSVYFRWAGMLETRDGRDAVLQRLRGWNLSVATGISGLPLPWRRRQRIPRKLIDAFPASTERWNREVVLEVPFNASRVQQPNKSRESKVAVTQVGTFTK